MPAKTIKKPLIPKLRFPEFLEDGEWRQTTLECEAKFYKGKGVSKADISERGTTSVIRYGELYIRYGEVIDEVYSRTSLRPKDLFLSREGDVLIPSSGETKIDIATASCVTQSGIGLGGDLNVIRSRHNGSFLSYYLNGSKKSEIAKIAQGGTVIHLYSDALKLLQIELTELPEQQKIADCLSSLDSLITAHSAKLAALQLHKKGLLQKLFPNEGQTTPNLRFPEFEDDGDWRDIHLKTLGKLISGLTYSPSDIRDKGLLVLRSSNVQNGEISFKDCVYVDPDVARANLSQPDDILICVRNGSTRLIGKNALIPKVMPLCTHGAFMTIFRSEMPKFVFQLFQTPSYNRQVAADLGATINSINGNQFLKFKFRVPKQPEQQKIASCLSSLDSLITAQVEKMAALKTHKKGLMQQLFPSPQP